MIHYRPMRNILLRRRGLAPFFYYWLESRSEEQLHPVPRLVYLVRGFRVLEVRGFGRGWEVVRWVVTLGGLGLGVF